MVTTLSCLITQMPSRLVGMVLLGLMVCDGVITADAESFPNEAVVVNGPVVMGRVLYRGSVPPAMQVQVERDHEICGHVSTVTTVVVDPVSHGVRDAIVHVGKGDETLVEGEAQVSMVQNKQCAFIPRIAALRAGGVAEISSVDPIMHNTNVTIDSRTVLNVALVPSGNSVKKPLRRAGLHLVKCNVHKFMQAYRHVFPDPFFDQTNEQGNFRIHGLPPGVHTITVWHETLGVLTKEIHVPADGEVQVNVEFK